MNKKKYPKLYLLLSIIPLVPILFYSSKYFWLTNFIIPVYGIFMFSINYSYMGECSDSVQIEIKSLKDLANLLFSDRPTDQPYTDKEVEKTLTRIRDFSKMAENRAGAYPEDFNHKGWTRDDRSTIHSAVPAHWGIDEQYDFGDYNDLSKRKSSAAQIVNWLEYDKEVFNKQHVTTKTTDNTFNASGAKWWKDFCKDYNLNNKLNTYDTRQLLRDVSQGKK